MFEYLCAFWGSEGVYQTEGRFGARGVEGTEEWTGCLQRLSFWEKEGCFGRPPPAPSQEKVGDPCWRFWESRGWFGRPEHAPSHAEMIFWFGKRPGRTYAWETGESAVSESEWWACSPDQAAALNEEGNDMTHIYKIYHSTEYTEPCSVQQNTLTQEAHVCSNVSALKKF